MSRRLRAVFRFKAADDPARLKPTLALLLRTLRIIRIGDPDAQLNITPDPGDPVSYDQDGD